MAGSKKEDRGSCAKFFESQYERLGFETQRRYPNESLLAFLGSNYFHLPIEKRSQIKVLALGCGSGSNLWMIAREGFDAYGVDFSKTGLDYCRKMLHHWNVDGNLKYGDMTDLAYADNFFDVIFDVVAMQHLTFAQHFKAYKEIFRCLNRGGMFFSYHLGENSISLKSTTSLIDHCTVEKISDGYPLSICTQTCFISANEVRKLLCECGFVMVKIEKIIRSYANQTQYIEYLSITGKK